MPATVLIVDDHPTFRRFARQLLEEAGYTIVGEAADGAEGVKLALAARPDVLLLDLNMPGISGIDAMKSILERAPDMRVVMLTVSEDSEDLIAALRAGAAGYLLKNIDAEFLVASVRRAAAGQSVISGELTDKLVRGVREGGGATSDATAGLSPREREILALLARGASNKEIARDLGVAESTVKIHVQHILRKLDLTSRVQAAVWATGHGLSG
jgi:two-component system nitrate/nitrite response regulator NarL